MNQPGERWRLCSPPIMHVAPRSALPRPPSDDFDVDQYRDDDTTAAEEHGGWPFGSATSPAESAQTAATSVDGDKERWDVGRNRQRSGSAEGRSTYHQQQQQYQYQQQQQQQYSYQQPSQPATRPPLTLRTSSFSKPSSSEDALSPLSRQVSQLRTGGIAELGLGRPRSGTVSSVTSNSSACSRDPLPLGQDTSRRSSLHRSVLDRNSHQQGYGEVGGVGGISRSATVTLGDRWGGDYSDFESDGEGLRVGSSSGGRKRGTYHPVAAGGTEWSHRYYVGETSFQSSSDVDGDVDEAEAVGLVEDGKSRMIDASRVASWGGVTRVTERLRNESVGVFDGGVIDEFDGESDRTSDGLCADNPRLQGATHVLLSHVGLGEQIIDLLDALLPIIASTLVVLDISNNLLLDLPRSLARCQALEELDLAENPVVVLPEWMGELPNLRVLVADGCGLRTLPAGMGKARLLHTICGESCKFSGRFNLDG